MPGYIIKDGKYVRSGGKRLRGTDCTSCEFVQLLKCDDDSESGFWLSTSDIPDGMAAAKYSGVCYYFSDPVLCVPDGGTVLKADDVSFLTDCDTCSGATPCWYLLAACSGDFSEAMLAVLCSSVPGGKTSTKIGDTCFIITDMVSVLPDGYTVVAPSTWFDTCPKCFASKKFADCATACAHCPLTFTVFFHYHHTDGYTDDGSLTVTLSAGGGGSCSGTGSGTVTRTFDDDSPEQTITAGGIITCHGCTRDVDGHLVTPGHWSATASVTGLFSTAVNVSCPSGVCVCCFPGATIPNPLPGDIDVWSVFVA